MAEAGVISVITRRTGNKLLRRTEVIAITGGPYDLIRGKRSETFVISLGKGESTIVCTLVLLRPVRITNLGNGVYRVSRPWPWIFGEGRSVKQAECPAQVITGRIGRIAHLA